ncbi:MAG: hypothetical protein CVU50_05030 [Candidatus Cloacimonetes bacterium HGW-Cloacimonetes-3]|jgi:hypothetical protein|nr:MAG: hypothetical protein CVU50_05030 [Candidatus Cloacimonetes bacterium HGW-Cloacimonetes-3]
MKKAAFILVMSILVFVLGAQTGFFDLNYGDSFDVCDETLYYSDFEYVGLYNNTHIYYPYEESDYEFSVDEIKLYFENGEDELTGWAILYYPSYTDDIGKFVVDGLKKLHGENCVYHEKEDYYTWEFGNRRFMEAGFTSDHSRFYVEYRTMYELEE